MADRSASATQGIAGEAEALLKERRGLAPWRWSASACEPARLFESPKIEILSSTFNPAALSDYR